MSVNGPENGTAPVPFKEILGAEGEKQIRDAALQVWANTDFLDSTDTDEIFKGLHEFLDLATDFLKNTKDKIKLTHEIKKNMKKTKEMIKTQFMTEVWGKKVIDDAKINKMGLDEVWAYLGLIDWLGDKSLDDIKVKLQARNIVVEAENAPQVKLEARKTKLEGILDVTAPDQATAELLFGWNKANQEARDALFDETNISPIITTPTKPNDIKLQKLIAVYIWNNVQIKDIAKIEIIKWPSAEYKENFIKVTLSNGTFKDILFCEKTDYIHLQRAEKFKTRTEAISFKETTTKEVAKDDPKAIPLVLNTGTIQLAGTDITVKWNGKIKVGTETTEIDITSPMTKKNIWWVEYMITRTESTDGPKYIFKFEKTKTIEKSDLFKEDGTNISDSLRAIDGLGAHYAFKETLTPSKLQNLLDKNILTEIDTFHQRSDVNDKNTKENGYYNIITNYVISETQKSLPNITLLQSYLSKVNAQNIRYLWTDKTTQSLNFNNLADLANRSDFPRNPVGIEAITNIKALWAQLQEVKWIQDALKDGVDGFFQAFGKNLISILEFFGGKGCVKNFFHSLGMDTFYDKNLKAIEDNINKLYKEKFDLSKGQKEGIYDIIWKDKKNFNTKPIAADTKAIHDAINGFKNQNDNTKRDWGAAANNQKFMTEKLKGKTELLDPTLVHYLITKTFDKTNWLSNDDGKPLDINKFVYKDATTKERKINDAFKTDTVNQDKLFARLFADQTTRDTIEGANQKIEWRDPDLTDKKAEMPRPDLGATTGIESRQKYAIQTDYDIARFFSAYAFAWSKSLDYVITESGLEDDVQKWSPEVIAPQPKKLEYVAEMVGTDRKVTSKGNNKAINEVVVMANAPQEIVITHTNNTKTNATRKNFTEWSNPAIDTYTYTDGKTEKKVILKEWDIITEKNVDTPEISTRFQKGEEVTSTWNINVRPLNINKLVDDKNITETMPQWTKFTIVDNTLLKTTISGKTRNFIQVKYTSKTEEKMGYVAQENLPAPAKK